MSDEVLRKRIDELDAEFAVPLPAAETHEELIARLEGFEIPVLEVVPDEVEPDVVPDPVPVPQPEPEIIPETPETPEVPEEEPDRYGQQGTGAGPVGPTGDEKTITLEAIGGAGRLSIEFSSAMIVRDEFGRVASLIGPDFVRTLVRDEKGAITGVLQEREQIVIDE